MSAPARSIRSIRRFAVHLALLAGSACAPRAAHDPFRPTPTGSGGITVEVVDDHVLDMRVYLVRGVTPIPLGSVGSGERRVFRVSAAELGQSGAIQLMADPLGSQDRFVTEPIQVAPGQRVAWRLAHRLSLSSVTVRW
jgi:hypothetical protein